MSKYEAGDLLRSGEDWFIVESITIGEEPKIVSLEKHLMKNKTVLYNGAIRTLQDIVDMEINELVANSAIHVLE